MNSVMENTKEKKKRNEQDEMRKLNFFLKKSQAQW